MKGYKKFVIAYDKFKDCMEANQLCDLTKEALEKILINDSLQLITIPLADGGDGFLNCIEASYASSKKESAFSSQLFSHYAMNKITLSVTGPLATPVDVIDLKQK